MPVTEIRHKKHFRKTAMVIKNRTLKVWSLGLVLCFSCVCELIDSRSLSQPVYLIAVAQKQQTTYLHLMSVNPGEGFRWLHNHLLTAYSPYERPWKFLNPNSSAVQNMRYSQKHVETSSHPLCSIQNHGHFYIFGSPFADIITCDGFKLDFGEWLCGFSHTVRSGAYVK